ncbi:uncharacterized protein J8A68_004850 [[Candida] subhashii]|uniref:Bile pigment transporter 1 n=1 Tax=[Candida] subhashii TaxID=561895 RepID=A0A8J5QJG7_9ASCO|nr:uncharacterized protein J8A68_004850 [[Candida] subhashii]KAG7661583.1 hypothetical protein J8A68_004850 [[Candida] subhashii]
MMEISDNVGLTCGIKAILHPMAPHNENAFNPCFITLIISLFSGLFLIYTGTSLYLTLSKTRYGSLLPKSTGMKHYIRINSVLLQIVLFAYLSTFIDIQERSTLIAFIILLTGLILVILPLHFVETSYEPIPSDPLVLFWPFLTLIELALYFQDNYTNWQIIKPIEGDTTIQIVEILLIVNSICIFIMEYANSWKPSHDLILHYARTEQLEKLATPNVIERITFSWMNELISNSYKNETVTNAELPNTPEELSTINSTKRIRRFWKGRGNLGYSLLLAFGWGLLVSFAYELGGRLLNFAQPQFLRFLILYFNVDNPPLLQGILICLAMFANTLIQTSFNNEYMLKNLEVGLNCRSSLTALIYQKALVLSTESKLRASTGDIVNLMSVDVNRIQNVLTNLSTLILAPIDVILCIVSLWPLLGKATLAGIFTIIFLVPVNAVIIKYSKRLNKTQMKLKDNRSRIINEILTTIKSIKLYAWENPMFAKLSEARNDKELKNLVKIRLVNQVGLFIWNVIPFVVSFSSFVTFVLIQDKPLTSDIVFPALALLNLLSSPLLQFPMVITSMIEAGVAIERIRNFLMNDEIDESMILRFPESSKNKDDIAVRIENATFHWSQDKTKDIKYTDEEQEQQQQTRHVHALRNVNFEAKRGELSCIVGKVGSGKTSLLYGLLGQLKVTSGDKPFPPLIQTRGTIAYCSQQPWIMNASVKENILFGCRFDQEVYQQTIEACQLIPDLAVLPDGDDTQVGEKGVSLSGGQKARLALARAIYSRADIYLLDDILSAVDSYVGNQIVQGVLSKPDGLLASKTIILCTNSTVVLSSADKICLVEDGEITETSSFQDVTITTHPKLYNIINNFNNTTTTTAGESSLSDRPPTSNIIVTDDEDHSPTPQTEYEIENLEKGDERELELVPKIGSSTPTPFISRRASVETFRWDPLGKLLPNLRSGQNREVSQTGKVQWSVYFAYIKACSITGGIFWLFLLLMASALSVGANYWLKYWTEKNSQSGKNEDTWNFIIVYAIFGLGATIMTVARGSVMMLWLGLNASRKIHDKMAKRVMYAPMSFFEETPVGRIMNRFTNDVNKIDDGIPQVFQGFIAQTVKTVFTLGVVSYVIPLYIIVISLLSIIYGYYEIYYVSISRELKRLVSVSRSPIYGHLGESLNGIDTIRAYRQNDRFTFINNSNIDFNLKSVYMLRSINRWLFFRLQFIGGVGVLSASSLSILSLRSSHPLTASMAGFVMTYALQVTNSLKLVVRTSASVETSIVAVERCLEYMDLPIEEEEQEAQNLIKPPQSWPTQGVVQFKNYSTRYRPNLDLVLKHINLHIKSGERIGIVGRTGAGKSSLALAIFRIIEPVEGHINIDKLNTSRIFLYDLRRKLSIIPQDCQLIEGTIRQNLDPFNYYTDEEVWEALELAHLKDHVLKFSDEENQLSCKVYEGGSNFSSGQRQLMSLARVLLKMKDSKVLVLDEATAAVDVQTDKIIQETIRNQFRDKTIITIAHRLETVMDNDRIVTLENGEVQEFDAPGKLLQNKDGIFYKLCKEGGLV